MYTLASAAQTLVGVLAGAASTNDPTFSVAYADMGVSGAIESCVNSTFNDTTDVEMVGVPAEDARVIRNFSLRNTDTVAHTFIIKIDDNGTQYTLWRITLQPDEDFILSRGSK